MAKTLVHFGINVARIRTIGIEHRRHHDFNSIFPSRSTATMGRGPKKHQKRLSAPSHWLLDKLSGAYVSEDPIRISISTLLTEIHDRYAPKASPGPHKARDCMPLIIFIRNR